MNPYDPTLSVPDNVAKAAKTVAYYFGIQGIHNWELMGICSRKRVVELEEQLKRANERQPVTLNEMPTGDPPQDRDERSWVACEDKLAESLFRLAHEIRDSRKTQESLLKFLQDNFGAATKKDLEQLGKKIMSAISDFADKVDAWSSDISASVDGIVTSITGITEDVQSLKKKIDDLQNSTGGVTPEDQARIDAMQVAIEKLATRSKAAADAIAALDAATETVPTPTP